MNRTITLSTLAAILLALSAPIASAGSYQDAMRTCGAEWRASEARTHVVKGEGSKAWNAFRATCTARIGWERKSKPTGTVSPSSPTIQPLPANPPQVDPARAS